MQSKLVSHEVSTIKLLPDLKQTDNTRGRYEASADESELIGTERSLTEPFGLERGLLEGKAEKKKRVRRVSNLSLNFVEEDQRSSLFKSRHASP